LQVPLEVFERLEAVRETVALVVHEEAIAIGTGSDELGTC
jgi:hypothetical protein